MNFENGKIANSLGGVSDGCFIVCFVIDFELQS